MLSVSAVQIALIYFGGSMFRTAGLTGKELAVSLALAALVIPADLLRKWAARSLRAANAS